jgi:hypothetical protein
MSLMPERPREDGPQGFSLDVVGIGALNLDYIASSNSLSTQPTSLEARVSGSVADSTPLFEWGAETLVEEQAIYDQLASVNAASLDVSLGGSSFNAIFALARMQIGIRLGYVGIAGRVLIPGLSSLQQFDLLG